MTTDLDHLTAALADRYRIERELGRGGMATVYLAEDLKHHRSVALKVLRPDLAAILGPDRFLREIELAAGLTHPHILPVHDSGEAGGFLYYVMPYVDGESLRGRLAREKQLPVDEALQISREVADALSYAHARGVIHRDIKPENILLEAGHAVVADFGIARAIDAAGGDRLTETGVTLGTPAYMSPEQAGGSRDLDGRSDLYSLGCVLYEMLAGQPPFTGPTIESVVAQHLSAPPPDVTTIRPSVPSWAVAALQRSLAKTPADRFNPVAQFGEAIAPRASVAEVPLRVSLSSKRRWWTYAVAIVVLAVAVAGVAGRLGLFTARQATPIGPRPYTIIAAFDGSAPLDVREAARTFLGSVLDESEVVQALPEDRIRRGLNLASRPDTTRLVESLARELAIRGGIRTVVTGVLDRVGSAYALSVRVVDVSDSSVLISAREQAASEDAVLDAVDQVGRTVRRGLGERPEAIASARPALEAMTPSFAAYLKYVEGAPLGNGPMRRTLLREAITLDPDFAQAWLGLAIQYYVINRFDSAWSALNEAERRPERLPPAGLLGARGIRSMLQHDMPGMLAAYQEMVDRYDQGHTNFGFALNALGRRDEAREQHRVSAGGPFPSRTALFNYAEALATAGDFDGAMEVVDRADDPVGRLWGRVQLVLMTRNWEQTDSLAAVLVGDPRASGGRRQLAAAVYATVRGIRGQIREAERGLDSVEAAWLATTGVPSWWFGGAALLLRTAAGHTAGVPSTDCAQDATAETLVLCGFTAAIAGDTTQARSRLAAVLARDSMEVAHLGCGPRLVQAAISARAGQWDSVPHLLGSALSWTWPDKGTIDAGNVVRWIVAEAYERTGRADSAAAIYELFTSPQEVLKAQDDWRVHQGMVVYSFAHFRLGRLYTQLEQYDRAQEHYLTFLDTFTQPDPEYEWMVTEARAKLEELARGR